VVVVVILLVSMKRCARPDGQLGSSIISTVPNATPIRWTHVVIPESNVQLAPSGGVWRVGRRGRREGGGDGGCDGRGQRHLHCNPFRSVVGGGCSALPAGETSAC
jgi:hypothetical protein